MKINIAPFLLSTLLSICFSQIALAQCEGTISGTVTIQGAPCVDCKVKVLVSPTTASLVWDAGDEMLTDANGLYSVQIPENAEVIIIARAADTYPNTVPTFSGSVTKWGIATTYINTCAETFSSDVAIVSNPERTGATVFTGNVYQVTGKTQAEEPIPLIDVVVERTPPGNSFAATLTDVEGGFVFEDMEADETVTYTIRVNLPCVPMENIYTVVVTPEDLAFNNLDFCINEDISAIATCYPTSIETFPSNVTNIKALRVAQHPESDGFALLFDAPSTALTLRSITGAVVLTRGSLTSGEVVPFGQLTSGIYIAEVVINGAAQRVRVPKL